MPISTRYDLPEPVSADEALISPNDQMYAGNPDHYFSVGQSAFHAIRKALRVSAEVFVPRRILDLPCGHGRVLRVLRTAYPDAEISACDTNSDGVAFCTRIFGAVPIAGSERITDTALTGEYDLIWCGSLVTHLDEPRISSLLELFREHLAPHGVLVFTAHGRRALARGLAGTVRYFPQDGAFESMADSYRSTGFAYRPYAGADYGISLSSPSWVMRKLEGFSDLRMLLCYEAGWDDHQDVYACMKV